MSALSLVDALAGVAGPVLHPGDDGYAAELAGFDLAVPQHPAVVVGATGAADLVAGVRAARAAGLAVGVQATGHGIPPSTTPTCSGRCAAAGATSGWSPRCRSSWSSSPSSTAAGCSSRARPDNVFRINHDVPPRAGS